MYIKPPKFVIDLLLWALGLGLFLFASRRLLPLALPFLIAAALAALLEPAVGFLVRRGSFPRTAAAALCTLLLFGLLLWLAVRVVGRGVDGLGSLAARLPELLGSVLEAFERMQSFVLRGIGTAQTPAAEYLRQVTEAASGLFAEIPAQLSGKLPGLISAAVEKTPAVLLFSVTAGLGTFFISASYPEMKGFLLRQVPPKRRETLGTVWQDLRSTLGNWAKAQLQLLAATFAVLLCGFLLLRTELALAAAAVIAVIDALPVLGAGLVLVPWALFCLLTGDYTRAAGLLLLWAAVTLLRSLLQTKIVGDRLGLHPLVSLTAVYLGFCTCGVAGMLMFPIAAVMLVQLNRRGILRLWKLPDGGGDEGAAAPAEQ